MQRMLNDMMKLSATEKEEAPRESREVVAQKPLGLRKSEEK